MSVDREQADKATLDLFEFYKNYRFTDATRQITYQKFSHYNAMTHQVSIDLNYIREQNPIGAAEMLMAYPDVMAPLLDPKTMLRLWKEHKLNYPNFLKSLPDDRRKEILKLIVTSTAARTKAHKRGEEPTLTEILQIMDPTYREALEHLLPPGDDTKKRVLAWLMF